MMRMVLTYEEIGRWLQNWLEIDMRVNGFATSEGTYGGTLRVLLPKTGTRNLLPPELQTATIGVNRIAYEYAAI